MPKIKVFANIYQGGNGATIIGFDTEPEAYGTAEAVMRQARRYQLPRTIVAVAVPIEIEFEEKPLTTIPSVRAVEYASESRDLTAEKRREFEMFLALADEECDRLASISIFDLTDKMWRDFFDEGRDPKECAREALLDDGYPPSLID